MSVKVKVTVIAAALFFIVIIGVIAFNVFPAKTELAHVNVVNNDKEINQLTAETDKIHNVVRDHSTIRTLEKDMREYEKQYDRQLKEAKELENKIKESQKKSGK